MKSLGKTHRHDAENVAECVVQGEFALLRDEALVVEGRKGSCVYIGKGHLSGSVRNVIHINI